MNRKTSVTMGTSNKINRFTLVLTKTTILMLFGTFGEAKTLRTKEGESTGNFQKSTHSSPSRFTTHHLLLSGNPPQFSETTEPDTTSLQENFSLAGSTYEVAVCSDRLPYYWNGNIYSEAGKFSTQVTKDDGSVVRKNLILTVNQPNTWYPDADGDGFGNGNSPAQFCDVPLGFVKNNTDCNDSDSTIQDLHEYFVDSDGDGFGSDISVTFCSSTAPRGYSTFNTDCDDANSALNPMSTQRCRGINNELNSVSFSTYPNVSTGKYTVALHNGNGSARLELYSPQGVQLWEKSASAGENTHELNIESQPSGIYSLKCHTQGTFQNIRLVKL